MSEYEKRSGYCPTLKKDYSVSVEQISVPSGYIDGIFDCEYAEMHQCPKVKECPVARIRR